MSQITVNIEWPVYTEDGSGNEVETIYQIECGLTPITPAKIHGPPEDCHPEEGGECEIQKITLDGNEIPASDWKALGLDEEGIAEKAREAAPGQDDDDPPDPRED